MIECLNNNQGLMSAILSIMGFIISVVAIWISISISRKQNRIALFDKKFEVYKSLEEYFNSSKGWPKAVNKFLNPGSSMITDNVWAPEINEIAGKAVLLFSKGLSEKIIVIKDKFAEVRRLDSCISSYFALLEELSDYQEVRPQFIEYLQDDSPTIDEEKKFEELCKRTAISTTEPIGYGEFKPVGYNFYDLIKNQSDLYREITASQKVILENILGEIKPL